LPPDPAPGHPAHEAVRWGTGKWPHAWFLHEAAAGSLTNHHKADTRKPGTGARFQATLGWCGSQEAAFRVARACYLKFDEGLNMEEVKQYRQTCYDNLKKARGESVPDRAKKEKGSKRKEAEPTAEPTKEAQPAKAPKAAKEPAELPDNDAGGAGVDDAAILALLPSALSKVAAQHKIKRQKQPNGQGYTAFEWAMGSRRERLQTTFKGCGGSKAACEHLARLCIDQFEQGLSRDEVMNWRDEMYAKIAESHSGQPQSAAPKTGEPAAKKPKNGKKVNGKAGLESVREQLRSEGRLEGAVHVKGRDEKKKNASVNGVYALTKIGFEGKPAYAKADGSVVRVLFYSARKSRWKINDSLNDASGGFAFAKASDGGAAAPGPSLTWQVFDGGGAGYNEDSELRCEPFASGGGRTAGSQDSDSDNAEEASTGSESSASDDAASTSESGDDESEAAGQSPPAQASPPVRRVPHYRGPPARACAKMLVNSGLRCARTFSLLSEPR